MPVIQPTIQVQGDEYNTVPLLNSPTLYYGTSKTFNNMPFTFSTPMTFDSAGTSSTESNVLVGKAYVNPASTGTAPCWAYTSDSVVWFPYGDTCIVSSQTGYRYVWLRNGTTFTQTRTQALADGEYEVLVVANASPTTYSSLGTGKTVALFEGKANVTSATGYVKFKLKVTGNQQEYTYEGEDTRIPADQYSALVTLYGFIVCAFKKS